MFTQWISYIRDPSGCVAKILEYRSKIDQIKIDGKNERLRFIESEYRSGRLPKDPDLNDPQFMRVKRKLDNMNSEVNGQVDRLEEAIKLMTRQHYIIMLCKVIGAIGDGIIITALLKFCSKISSVPISFVKNIL